jgi:hypothetical protein
MGKESFLQRVTNAKNPQGDWCRAGIRLRVLLFFVANAPQTERYWE